MELSDDKIVRQVTEDFNASDTNNEKPVPTQPTSLELTRALMTLSLVYSNNTTYAIEADIIAGKWNTVQKKISDLFAPRCYLSIEEIPMKRCIFARIRFFGLPEFPDVFAVPWVPGKSDVDCITRHNAVKTAVPGCQRFLPKGHRRPKHMN